MAIVLVVISDDRDNNTSTLAFCDLPSWLRAPASPPAQTSCSIVKRVYQENACCHAEDSSVPLSTSYDFIPDLHNRLMLNWTLVNYSGPSIVSVPSLSMLQRPFEYTFDNACALNSVICNTLNVNNPSFSANEETYFANNLLPVYDQHLRHGVAPWEMIPLSDGATPCRKCWS